MKKIHKTGAPDRRTAQCRKGREHVLKMITDGFEIIIFIFITATSGRRKNKKTQSQGNSVTSNIEPTGLKQSFCVFPMATRHQHRPRAAIQLRAVFQHLQKFAGYFWYVTCTVSGVAEG